MTPIKRLNLKITGIVQGVGFRPFIYRLAQELNLKGWVKNTTQGVLIEVEGSEDVLQLFLENLSSQTPPLAEIFAITPQELLPIGYSEFTIIASEKGLKKAVILPEIATCADCLAEIFDPLNRRFRYPFTNCTNCGPRYSIIESLPYDRVNTTMRGFIMCPACQKEYEDPLNRRFHAQPNACPLCGPHLELWDDQGQVLAQGDQALLTTVKKIQAGKILAIKGLGGFHLVVDAHNATAVELLRQRKHRPHKPFALMYPSLKLVKNDCEVSELEERLLTSFQSPIVLLKAKNKNNLADNIAPNNLYLGIMLPYTPLHHLLMRELNNPIVATSGNLADEPICTDEYEALERLKELADLFLVHNRPIVRPLDDSIVREICGKKMILRRARGYAPLPIRVNFNQQKENSPYLAVGSHLKNTIAVSIDNQIFLSQHIGDLSNQKAFDSFQEAIATLTNLYELTPAQIICDLHPDYLSSQYAHNSRIKTKTVPHHYAHILGALADNNILNHQVLGVAWDGTGYGVDQTIWGGEFLQLIQGKTPELLRVGYFEPFPLVGGDKAVKEPRRSALGLLYQMFGDDIFNQNHRYFFIIKQLFTEQELSIFARMLKQQLNCPFTSSVGRLFDGISALLNLYPRVTFEGQGAMDLEFRLDPNITDSYALNYREVPRTETGKIFRANFILIIQWQSLIKGILDDRENNQTISIISAKFHNSLTEIIIKIAQKIGLKEIVLTGGCFQNKYLLEQTIIKLRKANFIPYCHGNIPPNDGGIAVGQIIAQWLNISE